VLRRPEVTLSTLWPVLREQLRDEVFAPWVVAAKDGHLPAQERNELRSVETEIKYSGYLDQQKKAIEKLKKAEQRGIPEWFDYGQVSGLSREMQEKLTRVRPLTLGQASRIPGVTPAALTLVNVYIEIQGKRMVRTA
jgi:tRNA uridine 5-carboxymethylaminomethyl modification enzyme